MKLLVRMLFVVVIVLAIVSLSSCAKKSYPAYTGKQKNRTVASANPAAPKKEPLRKHYIVPKKKKKILGSDYH
ncbi:MAG: hypothetical protein DRJ09_10245 [Bacteroidetes bacterium]|nr:MAG: hypothetical protein DRJ09_10245 [Bacteroidota bacterium]